LNGLITANLLALAIAGGWVVAQAYPPTRAVRLRNALLASPASRSAFEWSPAAAPSEFRQENAAVLPAFRQAVADLRVDSCPTEWSRALRLAEHLATHAQDRGPIQADLVTTYSRILEGYGYCADFVKAFLALAHAAGICARQWAFSFDGFGGHGHTIVEVFDRAYGKWIFLDVYNNFHACDAGTGNLLSALEFRDALLDGCSGFTLKPNGRGRAGMPLQDKLLGYYRRGLQEWYMINGNAVFTYDAQPLVRWTSRISGPVGQVTATLLGVHPRIGLLVTPDNVAQVQSLTMLGRRSRAVLALLALLALILIAQLVFFE
jgi:hypothetical protein